MSLTIKDTASEVVLETRRKITPQRLSAAVGPAVSRLVQRHLVGLGGNKKGWPTTRFWARAARSTNWQQHPEGTLISINQVGVRQRYYGGVIKPVKARALTIPISPVSYGHTASEFPELVLLKTKKGSYLVQHGQETKVTEKVDKVTGETYKHSKLVKRGRKAGGNAGRRIKATLNFLFKLQGSVTQKANHDVLPGADEVLSTAKAAIEKAFNK